MAMRLTLPRDEQAAARRIICEKTGYSIRSTQLLIQIFRRSSFANEVGEKSSEILEFIGDQVLGYYITKIVSERCGALNIRKGYSFRVNEGQFTQIKKALVNNETLAAIIDEWGLAKYLLFSKGDLKSGANKQRKTLADLFESILGAIAIDSDWNPDVLKTAVEKTLNVEEQLSRMIDNDLKVKTFDLDSAVTTLKELAEQGFCQMPTYDFLHIEEYNGDKTLQWGCRCSTTTDETGFVKLAIASSKKEAKKAVSYILLCDILDVQNKYRHNNWHSLWLFKNGSLEPVLPTSSSEKSKEGGQ